MTSLHNMHAMSIACEMAAKRRSSDFELVVLKKDNSDQEGKAKFELLESGGSSTSHYQSLLRKTRNTTEQYTDVGKLNDVVDNREDINPSSQLSRNVLKQNFHSSHISQLTSSSSKCMLYLAFASGLTLALLIFTTALILGIINHSTLSRHEDEMRSNVHLVNNLTAKISDLEERLQGAKSSLSEHEGRLNQTEVDIKLLATNDSLLLSNLNIQTEMAQDIHTHLTSEISTQNISHNSQLSNAREYIEMISQNLNTSLSDVKRSLRRADIFSECHEAMDDCTLTPNNENQFWYTCSTEFLMLNTSVSHFI
jgi:hypothetical protein